MPGIQNVVPFARDDRGHPQNRRALLFNPLVTEAPGLALLARVQRGPVLRQAGRHRLRMRRQHRWQLQPSRGGTGPESSREDELRSPRRPASGFRSCKLLSFPSSSFCRQHDARLLRHTLGMLPGKAGKATSAEDAVFDSRQDVVCLCETLFGVGRLDWSYLAKTDSGFVTSTELLRGWRTLHPHAPTTI